MRNFVRRHGATFLVALVTAAVTAGAPAIAATIADYAKNADRVDGRHAVGAGASRADRAGKLVATNADGVLPSNIIAKAADAEKLDGFDSLAFQKRVTGGCAENTSIMSVLPNGAVTCDPDDVDGGNAATLAGSQPSEFQRRVTGTCAVNTTMTAVQADGTVTCAADRIDGGNAASLDGLTRTDVQLRYLRTVVVRPTGTANQNGAAVVTAINSITPTPTASTPWLVKIEPGVYNVGSFGLDMRPYVDVEGSGPSTRITCACTSQPTVTMATNSTLRSLTAETTGGGQGGTTAVGIPLGASGAVVNDVAVVASGGTTFSKGMQIDTNNVVIDDVDVRVTSASGDGYGIVQSTAGSTTAIRDAIVQVSGVNGYGVLAYQGLQHVRRADVSAQGTSNAIAYYVQSGAVGTFQDGTAAASGVPVPVAASSNGNMTIDRSSLMATETGKAVDANGGEIRVGGSKIQGTTSIAGPGALAACAGTYRVPHYVLTNAACGTP